MHLAILELDKSSNNKVELMDIITLLMSIKMGARHDVLNDLGMTAAQYADRLRNSKDRAFVKSLLLKTWSLD